MESPNPSPRRMKFEQLRADYELFLQTFESEYEVQLVEYLKLELLSCLLSLFLINSCQISRIHICLGRGVTQFSFYAGRCAGDHGLLFCFEKALRKFGVCKGGIKNSKAAKIVQKNRKATSF